MISMDDVRAMLDEMGLNDQDEANVRYVRGFLERHPREVETGIFSLAGAILKAQRENGEFIRWALAEANRPARSRVRRGVRVQIARGGVLIDAEEDRHP